MPVCVCVCVESIWNWLWRGFIFLHSRIWRSVEPREPEREAALKCLWRYYEKQHKIQTPTPFAGSVRVWVCVSGSGACIMWQVPSPSPSHLQKKINDNLLSWLCKFSQAQACSDGQILVYLHLHLHLLDAFPYFKVTFDWRILFGIYLWFIGCKGKMKST